MGQLGFFDANKRLEALSAKGDPLEAIDRLVPWESFRAEIETVVLRLAEPGLQHSPPGDAGTPRRGMRWSPSAVFQPKQRAEKEAVKTANQIENRSRPELMPNQASKSTIVRGALMPSGPIAKAELHIVCVNV
jgi:hypothetical protein